MLIHYEIDADNRQKGWAVH